jgi:hypothetical protein
MKIFAAFPSKYLKAADLHDKHVQAVMSHVLLEEVENKDGAELLPVLYFERVPKGMILNKTNATTIADAYGDETDIWKGMPIILFPAMVAFGANTVEAIRMKSPSAAERIRAIKESPHADTLGEHMLEQRLNAGAETKPAAPVTAETMARAREVFLTKKPTPRPVIHDANGVIWDETEERPATEAETAELQNSMLRANAALETRRVLRGAPPPDDLDIPAALDRRVKQEPTVRERLLAEIPALATARDCLAWGLEMDRLATGLPKAERDQISEALLARQTSLLDAHVRPSPHQRRLFPIEGGAR